MVTPLRFYIKSKPHPAITDYDRYAEVEQALQQGKADVRLTSLPTTAEFETWELFRDEFVALLSPGSLHLEMPLSWEELAKYPKILNLRSVQHNKAVRDHLLQFGQTFQVDYEVREDSTILSMVKQGLGAKHSRCKEMNSHDRCGAAPPAI